MKIRELIEATKAKITGNIDLERDVTISTDTRTIKEGDFYLPLKGASFDGEKFIEQALEKGAVGSFCTTDINPSPSADCVTELHPLPHPLPQGARGKSALMKLLYFRFLLQTVIQGKMLLRFSVTAELM